MNSHLASNPLVPILISASTSSASCSYFTSVGFLVGGDPIDYTYITKAGETKTNSALQFSQVAISECICKESLTATGTFTFFDPHGNETSC